MKKSGVADRMRGGLLGMALGDALCRHTAHLSPDQAVAQLNALDPTGAPGPLLHGASTTACLAFLDVLVLPRSSESLATSFALKVETFAALGNGEALRGREAGIKGLWISAARHLADGERLSLVGDKAIRADALPLILPLAFALGDDDDEVADSLVQGLCLISRHPRVVASAAFLLGAWRQLIKKEDAGDERVLRSGERFAHRALQSLEEAQKGVLVESKDVALAALQAELAGWSPDAPPEALIFPSGMDGRDAPERVIALALAARHLAPQAAMTFLEDLAKEGGASDVLGPLVGTTVGLCRGAAHLPLGWMDRLAHRPLLDSRLNLLTEKMAPVANLLEWELAATRGVPPPSPPTPEPSAGAQKEQLKLL
jgi:ADP-ribosylglycohydrolase